MVTKTIQFHVAAKVVGLRRAKLRFAVAAGLIRLAAWLSQTAVEVRTTVVER